MGWTLSPPRTAVSVWLILPNTRSYLSDISGRYHGSWEPCKRAGCPVHQEVWVGSPLLTRTRGQPGPRHPQGAPPQLSAASNPSATLAVWPTRYCATAPVPMVAGDPVAGMSEPLY